MAYITCKICGGQILTSGEALGVCESCGTEVTLPRVRDDIRAEFYNRANYFRVNREFDRAYSEFEHIAAEDPYDAEARWSLVLCKYGVVYQQDRDGTYSPIVTKPRQEPIWEDPDYQAALKNSGEHEKAIYRAEAGKIDRFLEEYFTLVRTKPPYDVFLCYRPDEPYALQVAEGICRKLREKDIRVFHDGAKSATGTAYALNTSRILFAITAGPEDLLRAPACHQWRHFLELMEADRSRHIYPVYTRTEIYAIPEEIPTHEAICADRPGYWQDLVWGVQQILGKAVKKNAPDGQDYLSEAQSAFETGDFQTAQLMADQVLSFEPNNAQAHAIILLSKHKARCFSDLFKVKEDWENNTALLRIMELGSGELRDQAQKFHKEYCLRLHYQMAKAYMKRQEYRLAIAELEPLGSYEDAPLLLMQSQKLAHHKETLQSYRAETKGDPETHIFRIVQRDHPETAEHIFSLYRQLYRLPRAQCSRAGALACGLIMLLYGILYLFSNLTNSYELSGLLNAFGIFFLIVAAIYGKFVLGSNFSALVLGGLSAFALSQFYAESYDGIDNILLSLFPLCRFLREQRKERNYQKLLGEIDLYHAQTLEPLEQQIITDIKARYGSILSQEEIGRFCTVRSLVREAVELELQKEAP